MTLRQPLFGGGPRADREPRESLVGNEPHDHIQGEEAGAQRGGIPHPGDPNIEVDLLDDDGGRRPGGWRSGVAIVAALGVFVGVLWYAYDWGMTQMATTRLPMIVADASPIKSRPQNPGGIEVLNQDVAVLNDPVPSPETPQVERLLPPPETPQPPLAEAPAVESIAKVEELLGPPLATAAGPADEIMVAEADTPPVAEAAAPPAVPEIPVAVAPETTPEPALPEPEAATQSAPEVAAVPPATPAAASTEPAPQIAALPAANTGDFVVQLAALRAKDGARPAWKRIQDDHAALLGDRELNIQEVDLGDRGIFYRIQAGFFADRASARDTCNALKARGQDCLVVKR